MSEKSKVLIIDDDDEIREVLVRQLIAKGFTCAEAAGGEAGLELLRENNFDVALVDLKMLKMDGFQVLETIRETGISTVSVILCTHGEVRNIVDAMRLGAFDFVEKPCDPKVIQGVIERAIAHGRAVGRAKEMAHLVQQWEMTFDAVPDLIAIVDDQHRFVHVNKAMAEKLGCTPEEAVGLTCYERFHGTAEPPSYCPHTKALTDERAHIVEIYEKHLGGHFLLSASPLYDAQGRLIGTVDVARDVTEQKRIEEELRKSHAETDKLLGSMSSFLIEVDADLRVSRWNATAETTFGIPADEALGKPFVDCNIRWDWTAISGSLSGWLKASQPIRLAEVRYTRPDGNEGALGITVNPIKSNDDEPSGFFLMGADITKRRTLEAQLVQAQKLESIGQLAAGIAHEINTPTQYVGDNTRFLQEAFGDLSKVQAKYDQLLEAVKTDAIGEDLVTGIEATTQEVDMEYLKEEIPKAIQQSLDGVQRVAKIVRAMKEFSHPDADEKTPIDLNHAIESTITVARNEWKYVAEMVTEFNPELPLVPCLPGEFNQVILNITVNAAHAIAAVVGDGAEGKGTITIRTRLDGDWAEVQISDTGQGIPEEMRARIFDPFFTTKKVGKGTGQGLAIVHNVVVEKHGGTITFESEVGKGTTFIVRLPINASTINEIGVT